MPPKQNKRKESNQNADQDPLYQNISSLVTDLNNLESKHPVSPNYFVFPRSIARPLQIPEAPRFSAISD